MNFKKIKRKGCFALAFLLIIAALMLPTAASEKERPTLLVGGIPFGVRFFTDGILVVDLQ